MSENPGIYAAFSIEPVEQAYKSQQAGRPIFEDREYVRIVIAGDKNTEVYREATEHDKERFHEPYARFQKGLSAREQVVGTPLSEWPFLKASQIKEFEAINIYTVEQLAGLSDTMKQNIGMGAHEICAAAKAFLDSAGNNAKASELAAENERLKADIDMLRNQVTELADRISQFDPDAAGKSAKAPKAA